MKLNGPGKYDEAASVVMAMTGARGVLVMILGGVHGHGFEVHTDDIGVIEELTKLLREMADKIERGGG